MNALCTGDNAISMLPPRRALMVAALTALNVRIGPFTPPKHWASNEIPVVFDLADGNLCYLEKTPVWGAAYFAGFRREIENNLR